VTLGLVLRVDQGGLAVQTEQLAQYLQPDVILAVDLPAHARRGDSQLHRLGHLPVIATVDTDVIPPGILIDMARTVDRLITVECLYTGTPGSPEADATWRAVNAQTETVLVANPELYASYPAARIILPTSWCADRFPAPHVVPHPVDLAAVAPHGRERAGPARTFLHVEAPAMCDRNGSELVARSLLDVTEPCTLIVRSHRPRRTGPFAADQIGRVRVVWDNTRPASWVSCYHPDDVDVLLLPRRYGGLSLVVQEAAALGIPPVMLDVDPQRGEGWPGWRLPAHVMGVVPMRGGAFPVHACNPADLSGMVSALVCGRLDVVGESARALAWAEGRSWPVVASRWAAALA
jgi:glycosyltransferase involved in cell wall biosynthesis